MKRQNYLNVNESEILDEPLVVVRNTSQQVYFVVINVGFGMNAWRNRKNYSSLVL